MIKFEITKCENPKCFCNSNMFWLSVYFGIPHELRIGFSNSLKTDVRIFIGVSWTPQSNFSSMCTITILIMFSCPIGVKISSKMLDRRGKNELMRGETFGLSVWTMVLGWASHSWSSLCSGIYCLCFIASELFLSWKAFDVISSLTEDAVFHLLRGSLVFIFPSATMSIFVCIDPSFMPGEYPNPSGWVILLMWCWILLAMNFWEQF